LSEARPGGSRRAAIAYPPDLRVFFESNADLRGIQLSRFEVLVENPHPAPRRTPGTIDTREIKRLDWVGVPKLRRLRGLAHLADRNGWHVSS